jgi:tetratricopeptide (TPR) repeat protein
LALWSGQPRWQVMAGELQQQLGNLAEAADHFRQAAELEPEESKHLFALGRVQLARKNFAEAIGSLQKADELKPGTGDYLVTLAQAHRQNGDDKQAKSIANQALRAAPSNTAAMLLQAELALEENDGAKAKELAQHALTLTPKHVPALRIFAEALHLLGQSDEALAVLDRARATAEDEVPLLIRRAEIQGGEAGLRSLIKLSQKYPDRPEVFSALSQRLALAGATQDAIQAAQHAVKKADALPEEKQTALHLHLARLLKQSGNLDQSLHHLDQAALIQPHMADSHLERGRVFIARRQYRPALKAFQQAAQLAPSAPEPHYEAGLALKEAKDYAAAESELRQAAHLAPKDRTIQRQLATVIALNLVHHQEAGVAL